MIIGYSDQWRVDQSLPKAPTNQQSLVDSLYQIIKKTIIIARKKKKKDLK